MAKEFEQIFRDLNGYITVQYDYPPNGEGSIGYKGHNMYRFKLADIKAIDAFLREMSEEYAKETNLSALAQEVLSDLLDEGLIEYGGYGYKEQQKKNYSI